MISNYFNLTKLFIKSLGMSKVEGKKRKRIFNFLLFTVVFLIFIPFILFFGLFMFSMTSELKEVGYASIGLEVLFFLIAIFTFVFSFSVILNEFYFSDDIPSILPLPLKPVEIIASKFSACFFAENLMEFIMLFVGIIGYVLAASLPIPNLLLSLLGVFTLPIIPMIYSGIICLIVMYFTRFIKNKEFIRKLSIIAVLIVLVFFVSIMGALQNFDFDQYVESFASGNHGILNVSRILFPHLRHLVFIVDKASILDLLIYIGVHIVYLVVFFFLADKLYLKGVIGLYSQDTKTKSNSTKLLSNLKENTPFNSYLWKEFKVLFRSPTLFINCVLINFIWPIFVYVIYKVSMASYDFTKISRLFHMKNEKIAVIVLLYIVGVSIFLPALNSIAASSFSREGKHFSFIKYIPMKYRLQWYVKILVSFLLSFIGIQFYVILFCFFVKVPIHYFILYFIISFFIVLFMSCLGITIDSIQPKLVWDDEINALRENYNTFMLMGFALLLFIFFVGGSYFLYHSYNISFYIIAFSILIICLLLSFIIYRIIVASCAKNLIEQEEM